MNYTVITLNIMIGIIIGFSYAQLFLWRRKITTAQPIAQPKSHRQLLIPTCIVTLRLLLITSIFYLLLSWPEINPIIVLITFMGIFWWTILKRIEII